jgi:hypothetical protein
MRLASWPHELWSDQMAAADPADPSTLPQVAASRQRTVCVANGRHHASSMTPVRAKSAAFSDTTARLLEENQLSMSSIFTVAYHISDLLCLR